MSANGPHTAVLCTIPKPPQYHITQKTYVFIWWLSLRDFLALFLLAPCGLLLAPLWTALCSTSPGAAKNARAEYGPILWCSGILPSEDISTSLPRPLQYGSKFKFNLQYSEALRLNSNFKTCSPSTCLQVYFKPSHSVPWQTTKSQFPEK